MAQNTERDLVGYGPYPPDPKWPGKARIALNFVINYEEGSEYSIGNGDGFSEVTLTETANSAVPHGERDLTAESMFEFGSRVGFWRLMRVFDQRALPVTIYASALALEKNDLAAKAITESGHDVCAHGWRWIEQFKLSQEEEREQIRRAIESLEKLTGQRPVGWYCRYGPSVNTRRLLVKEGGFIYDSDAYNDELPYWTVVNEKPHLVIPHTLTNNDAKFGRFVFGTGNDFFTFLKDAFDVLRAEGTTMPKMMTVSLHPRLTGHPARTRGLERFLDHVCSFDDVWICHRIDIAQHWIENHPYESIDE
jgi:peptidoglycan/xylan/chitin deacetylase (PgdA/CDA1 family)